jgi:hypothetical protein
MRQQWMNDLHDRMEHYEKKAPGGLLGDIKREMSARGIRPLSVSSPEKHRTVWLKRFAAVASIAVLSLMAWHLTPDCEKYNPQRAHLSTDDVNSDENILQAFLPLLTQKYPTSKALPRETLHRFIASDMPVEEISQVVEETSVDTLPQDERKVEHTAHISKESDVVDAPLFASARHSKNSGFSLGIGITSSAADNQQQRTWLNMESIAFSPNDAENEQRPDIMEPSFLSAQNNVENTHYRQPVNYTEDTIEAAKQEINKMTFAYKQMNLMLQANGYDLDSFKPLFIDKFIASLADDLNTANALMVLYSLVKEANQLVRSRDVDYERLGNISSTLKDMFYVLGLDINRRVLSKDELEVYQQYLSYKKEKNFEKSDELREKLINLGIL